MQSDLILRNNSLIDTEALDTGNGGNITINSPVITGFENSDIIANAVEDMGGNIDIITSGIFGLEFREELTEKSDISASSEFVVSGTVQINNLSIDPSSGLVELPVVLADSSEQIVSGCSSNRNSTFIATGRGGIPHNLSQLSNYYFTWFNIRDLSAYQKLNNNNAKFRTISSKPAIVEATDFVRNSKGEIELVALENKHFATKQISECSGKNT